MSEEYNRGFTFGYFVGAGIALVLSYIWFKTEPNATQKIDHLQYKITERGIETYGDTVVSTTMPDSGLFTAHEINGVKYYFYNR